MFNIERRIKEILNTGDSEERGKEKASFREVVNCRRDACGTELRKDLEKNRYGYTSL